MSPTKKLLKPGQAGGLAVLKKYGPDHFKKMVLKYHRKRRKMDKLSTGN